MTEQTANRETILIVAPDPNTREAITQIVEACGYICRSVSDGPEALGLVKREDIDVVISDINLPDQNGLDLIPQIRLVKPRIAFIIIIGYGRDCSYDKIIRAGAQDLIKEPFTIDELRNKLKRILLEYRVQAENVQLLKHQAELADHLSVLISVATNLTAELDFDRLFPLIIGKVSEAMAAERTSLYFIDWERNEMRTKVAEQVDQIRMPMGKGIAGKVAETGETINVPDAWDLPYFNAEYDKMNNFRTKAVLCVPIQNREGERIGVIQVINKVGKERFDEKDEMLIMGLSSQVAIALENSMLHEEIHLSFDSSIQTLSATVDAKHPLTAGHSKRVTEYSLMIGEEMGMSDQEMEVLKYAALLHDIGKIGIRDKILLKNGRFTKEERTEMNTHPLKTKIILDNFRFPRALQNVPEVAAYHHEKINGQGYAEGLTGDQLPLGSMIIAVADVFDALTSHRDYPKYTSEETLSPEPLPLTTVISIMENDAGNHFNPDVVRCFLACLPKALLRFRGEHFDPEYVDEVIRSRAPELLK